MVDKALIEKELQEKGVVKVRILDETEAVEVLSDFRSKFGGAGGQNSFYWSMYDKDKKLAAEANDYISELLLPKLTPYFGKVQSLLSSFFVKPAGGDFIEPHQDWTFIDGEPLSLSFTCWVPLIDIDFNSGTLGCVAGSHRLTNYVRASPSPAFPKFTNNQRDILLKKTTFFDLKVGEGIIFDHRIVHASSPSRLNSPRPAIGVCFAPAECTMIHYTRNPKSKNTVFKYKVDRDFYNYYNDTILTELFTKGENIPDYSIIGESEFRAITDDEIAAIAAQ